MAQVKRLAAGVAPLAGQLDRATVIALRKVFRPGEPALIAGDTRVRPTVDLARRVGQTLWRPESQLFVATPAVLGYLGIDPAAVDPGADFLADRSVPTDELVFPPEMGSGENVAVTNVQRIETDRHLLGNPWGEWAAGRKPTFITPNGLRRHGWKQIPAGWLVESEPAADERPDRRRPRARGGRRPHDRGATRGDLPRHCDGTRDRPPALSWRSPFSR